MPTVQERHRNNVRAGVFVSAAILLLVAVLLVLNDVSQFFRETKEYVVAFPITTGILNLTAGSEVRIGGLRMGEVIAIEPVLEEEPFRHIEVAIAVDSDVTLYSNAVILILQPLVGADAWINVVSVGDPTDGRLLAAGETIAGSDLPPTIAMLLGADVAAKSRTWFESFDHLTEIARQLPQDYRERLLPLLDETNSLMEEINALASRVNREDYPRWAEQFTEILARARQAAEELDAAMDSAQAVLDRAENAVTRVDELVQETAPEVEAAVSSAAATGDNVQAITARFREEILPEIEAIVARAERGTETYVRLAERLEEEFEIVAPDLEETLANAQLASEQLRLTMAEVRAAPWKLLYRPDAREYENALLLEAARSFAVAAGELDQATRKVERILDRYGAELGQDESALEDLLRNLQAEFERYDVARRRLMDILATESLE